MSETNRDFAAEAMQILCGEKAVALDRIVALLRAEASIAVIQQNANDNYAASEARLHACEEECERLRKQLAKDDAVMGAAAVEKQ